jgi:hypothetical protein
MYRYLIKQFIELVMLTDSPLLILKICDHKNKLNCRHLACKQLNRDEIYNVSLF